MLAAAAANTTFDLLFQGWIADHFVDAWRTLPADFSRAYTSTLNYILVFGVNMILFHVNYVRRAGIQQERRIAEANAAAHQAQLAALRYQLNPHFLFNSLNSISALIVTGRNKDAEAMTDRLSSFLRSSLNADPAELIPLDEELALTEEYLEIESVRFGDRLDIDGRLRAPTPARRWCRASSSSRWSRMRSSMASPARARRSRSRSTPRSSDGALRITVANCLQRPASDWSCATIGAPASASPMSAHRLQAVFGKRASLTAGAGRRPLRRHHLHPGGASSRELTWRARLNGSSVPAVQVFGGSVRMRVLLVDDEPLALDRLRTFFGDIEGAEVVGTRRRRQRGARADPRAHARSRHHGHPDAGQERPRARPPTSTSSRAPSWSSSPPTNIMRPTRSRSTPPIIC